MQKPAGYAKSIEVVSKEKSTSAKHVISTEDLINPHLAYSRIPAPHSRTRPRGICLLLNQKNFDYQATGQQKRDGTDVDADCIERTFIELGYFVNRATDLTLYKMIIFMTDSK